MLEVKKMKHDITQDLYNRYIEESIGELMEEDIQELSEMSRKLREDPVAMAENQRRAEALLDKMAEEETKVVQFPVRGKKIASLELTAALGQGSNPLASKRDKDDYQLEFIKTGESGLYELEISRRDKSIQEPISIFKGLEDGEKGLQVWMGGALLFDCSISIYRNGRLASGESTLIASLEEVKQLEDHEILLYLD